MFKDPFTFHGRIRRKEYALSFFIYSAMSLFIKVMHEDSDKASINFVIYALLALMLWFLFAQGAKRCHDLGRSGWLQLVPFYFVWLIFAEGRRGKNQYGEDPKIPGEEEEEVVYGKP